MLQEISCCLFGGAMGFSYFLYELESPDMGNIIFRKNSDNKYVFSPESILNIMKGPFVYSQFWTDNKLRKVNWLIPTSLGMVTGCIMPRI
jgi:hypothetical protein